jgi:outer membrane protein OmpA-like peptidoglycan-associated protein
MRRHWLAAVMLALAAGTGVDAATHADPDAPETQAAAREALGRAKVLDVSGVTLDVTGTTLDIVGVARGIEGVLQDLGARVTDREIRITMAADVLFDFDKATIRPDGTEALGKVAEVIRSHGSAAVELEGHTDGKGQASYNQKLSEQRAEAVKAWLAKDGGVPAARMKTRGYGMTRPAVPNTRPDGSDDPEGRQKNRRVEIVIQKR